MNAIIPMPVSGLSHAASMEPTLTMSSREIANMLGTRHDDVKRSIKRLAERETIVQPPSADEQDFDSLGRNRVTKVYRLDERSSYIVVAQLSPEFTARLVDEWKALKEQVGQSQVPALPQDYEQALEHLLVKVKQNNALRSENDRQALMIEEMLPVVGSANRVIASADPSCITDAAHALDVSQSFLTGWLQVNKWVYRRSQNSRIIPFAETLNKGWMVDKYRDSNGRMRQGAMVTPLGVFELGNRIHPADKFLR